MQIKTLGCMQNRF